MPENLRTVIEDIQKKLKANDYQNEEHVRLSLVARVVQALGWDIWDPAEVNTEFYAVPREDKTKVDMALFSTPQKPGVFIEIKAVGKLMNDNDLAATELQVRDYNRNNSAPFCVLTDGRFWRLYYSFTGGEFAAKCFRNLDFRNDPLDDVELSLDAFLSKENVAGGNARRDAEVEMQKGEWRRILESLVPQAARKADETGESAIRILIELMKEKDLPVEEDAAKAAYQDWRIRGIVKPWEPPKKEEEHQNDDNGNDDDDKQGRRRKKRPITHFIFLGQKTDANSFVDLVLEVAGLLKDRHGTEKLATACRGFSWFTFGKQGNPDPKPVKGIQSNGQQLYYNARFSSNAKEEHTFRLIERLGYKKSDLDIFPSKE